MKNTKLIQLSIAAMLTLGSSTVFAEIVNINKASAEAIAHHLSGIGIKKAAAIVEYRTDNGSFKAVDDLTDVKGIGEKLLEKNLADISLSNGVIALDESEPKVVTISSSKKAAKVSKTDTTDAVVTAAAEKVGTPKVTKEKQTAVESK